MSTNPVVLEITGKENGSGLSDHLDFDLLDLLKIIKDDGARLSWRIFPMGERPFFIVDENSRWAPVQELEDRVDRSDAGMPIAWKELLDLAGAMHQTVWGTFLAGESECHFAGLADLYENASMYIDQAQPEFYERVDLALQAIDSSYWLVYARCERHLAQFRESFRSTKRHRG